MTWSRWTFLLLVAMLLAGRATAPADAAVFSPETFTLDNGMQVVVVNNDRIPAVTHMVWYRVGSADEEPGKSGIAHFLEHLMFKGTPKHPEGEFSRIVASFGGRENAFTSYDYTGYYQTVARDQLPVVMELEADRMSNLLITPAAVETERQVVLEERRQRTDNNPGSILREQASAAAYLNHPYGRPIIGWEHEIRGLTLDDITAFHKRWYAPNNAILVVAGDITAAELRPLAERYYGVVPAGDVPERLRPAEPPQLAARVVTLHDERVRQPSWSRSFLAPSHAVGDKQQVYPLEVLSEILGGGATSRLYRSLVVESGTAISAGSWYDGDNLGPARFGLYASPHPDTDLDGLDKAVMAEVNRLLEDGVTADEVERAKSRLIAGAVYARDSLSRGARALGSALASGMTVDDVESWPERIEAVTPDMVDAAARDMFKAETSVTTRLLAPDDANTGL